MNITEPFVLKDDVLLIPCTELPQDMRDRVDFEEGDYTLSRRHGRGMAQVVDGETAALLQLFRTPRTIVDAVVANSRALGKDPAAALDELLPHLGKLLQNKVLVPAGSEEEKEIRPQYEAGATIGRWEIVRCASLIEDSEVYQLRSGEELAALKIARMPSLQTLIDNEAAILRRLEGSGIAPRLLETGLHDERPFLIIDWIAGVEATVAAAERRHDRASLIDMASSIAAAYASLHERGVLHADVHPRNVLAGERVTLLDFGYSQAIGQPSVGRAGMYYFFEPEYLAAQRAGVALPASAAGEQYALAAMLYLLMTGQHYLEFRYDRQEMAAQVESDPPVPFAARGIPPWPEVEGILFRALEKDPALRYPSVAAFAEALLAARERAVAESIAAPLSADAHALLEAMLRSFGRGGEMFATRYPEAPTATINNGSAGAAIGLLRIAEARSDAALLALADVWRSRAVALIGSDSAFLNPAIELTPEVIGDVTPYYTESGIHAAAAMVAAAKADSMMQERAIALFIRASNLPCAEVDVTLGRSGALLGAALLLEDAAQHAALRAFGGETMRAIWSELDERGPISGRLGIAHGWAGYLYAALRWCAASGDALPPRLESRLGELAALRIRKGRGVYWPVAAEHPPSSMMPGWCNGSAGYVFLFTLAHRTFGGSEWLELAQRCAWNAWDEPRGIADLCCGTAGRAYALLNFYKETGATEWLSRARQLANHAASAASVTAVRRNALWKGELGVATLIAELGSPETARMPFFE